MTTTPPFEIVDKPILISPFGAWRNGNDHVRVDPPPAGNNPRPFVVAFHQPRYHLGEVLVWAQSAGHAVERVWIALNECAAIEADYRASEHGKRWGNSPGDPKRILDSVASGETTIKVYEHDVNSALLAGPWASNNGLCY